MYSGTWSGLAASLPQTHQGPSSKLEISVSCRNLQNKDALSKSDPICVLFVYDRAAASYVEFDRTEVIKNSLNPSFLKKIIIDYYFEESQKLKFEIYDIDSPTDKLKEHDFLGGLECSLGEIVASKGSQLVKNLKDKKAMIIISALETSLCKDIVTFQFRAEKLDKKDFFGKSDPFLMIHKYHDTSGWTLCHKTEYISNTLEPKWKAFSIPVSILCNGDYERSIRIECYDHDDGSEHDLIGAFETTLAKLTLGPGDTNRYECINPKKQSSKRGYKNSGMIYLVACKVEPQYSFLDYIVGGTQILFTVAIDFTASNGDPNDPRSLHHSNPYQTNQYVQAIQAVGTIIQDYDSDKLFPVLGFGARVPPDYSVSHEFFVNLHPTNPYCAGVEGILQAYQQSLLTVRLYGPTNFSPVIYHVATKFAANAQDGSQYFILLIITDGEITDMSETKSAIIYASHLAMSIIIVGVGDADFSGMEALDSDKKRLEHNGEIAARDIVQFVPFEEYSKHAARSDPSIVQAQLAKHVLAEVPNQLLSFMKSRGIQPRPPVTQGQPQPT